MRENPIAAARQCTLNIAGRVFTVVQEGTVTGNCNGNISPLYEAFFANGGTGTITISTGINCAWEAESNVNWITITSASVGIGSSSVSYAVANNAGSPARRGTITVAGRTFLVKQKGN